MSDAFLGVNILHDTSAALVVDGELVVAVEEERFNRDRHTTAFPTAAIQYCLEQVGMSAGDLCGVAVTFDYPEFQQNTSPFEQNTIDHDDTTPGGREKIKADNLAIWQRAEAELARSGLPNVQFLRHHLTHAACGYYSSGFDDAGVIVFDGRGERESTSLWHAHGAQLDPLESYAIFDSLGQLYTYVTSLCGLYGGIGNEGKTMGLSGYGTGKLNLDDVVTFDGDRYHIDRTAMRALSRYRVPLGRSNADSQELAFAVQKKLEEAYLFLAARMQHLTGCRSLVLSGGVAFNCNANGVLAGHPEVDRLYIPPAANDAGTAIGAAFIQWVEYSGTRPVVPRDPIYLGPAFDDDSIEASIGRSGLTAVTKVSDPAQVAADAVAQGLVVGWFQGSMEFGPRALGNRSILADPRDAGMPQKVNDRVKFREPWRPFAPSVLNEKAQEWFEPAIESPYMLLSLNVRDQQRHLVPAITHVDGTSRIQGVTRDANPLYYRLIELFADRTGVPMVLNTSLNIRGEPIARTADDAIQCLVESGLDVLVMGTFVAWKDGVELDL